MSIQPTVDPHTEEILIEQQIIILLGFFLSRTLSRWNCSCCVFIHKLILSCGFFLCSYLPANLDPVFDFIEDTYGSLPSRGTLF